MRLIYSLLSLLILLPVERVYGEAYTHTQKVLKSYKISSESTIFINNKYGKVHISTWNNDSVSFEINLIIKSSNVTKVSRLRSNIKFDFVITKYNVSATTVFGSMYNSLFRDIQNLAESIVSSDNMVTIDYFVKVPVWANLNIENKYGDIFMDDTEGDLTINLSNGGIRANRLLGPSNLTLGSCDADINYIKDGICNVSYADMKIKEINKVDMISKSSTINIDQINYMKLDSRRDKYYIKSITKSFGDTYFSDFDVKFLEDEISYDMKYGNIDIDQVGKNFSLVNLSSEYTDISLTFDRSTTYNFDMTHFNDVIFYYPKEISKLQEKLVDDENKEFLVYGTIGASSVPKNKVNIKALKKCYVKIDHK